ncbi:transmembrane domain-containing protein [Cryptosporidium canis]|uniref:Transmembrane domain-containing protein n=1 Tax=Cryptosporidium canis TaxID=195482 RepID=A0ABQ8P5Y6_9CRYT|nr:transmembrane domain-containing protein [Cryptosporidium canis]KAJ1614789.1 transmembrane domain-containing protein [Cryptosporidium canis]
MDFGKYFSGLFTHSLTRSVNENQGSFEDRESNFLLVLKRNSDGDKIYKGLKETEEFNIYELNDLNSPRNLLYLVISLRFTNERISIKAEELQPNRENNLFWGDWPPSYSWVFFLGNILFREITQFECWENAVIHLIALHNGESLFELYEKSTRVFNINTDYQGKKKEFSESHLERIHENDQYNSIPRLFNILCEWCDYFGPNIMTIFWLLLVFFIISTLIFSINIVAKFGEFCLLVGLKHNCSIFKFTYYSKITTSYLILMIPMVTSIGLIFLKSILDDFPLPKHNQECLIYFSSNSWRNTNKQSKFCLNSYYFAAPVLIISIYIPLSHQIDILNNEYIKFTIQLIFSIVIFQTTNIKINIDVSRETYGNFWSLKLPIIIKTSVFFLYWKLIRQISNHFYHDSIDYFPFTISLLILTKNIFSVINSAPCSKNCIGFKLGPKEEMKRIPLGDYITYYDLSHEQSILRFDYIWNNLIYIHTRYTLYEDMWHHNLLIAILLSIYAEYPVTTSLILIINSILTVILLFSKILTNSTRPWLLNITLSHQIWKFIMDFSILFSISCFSSTPNSSNFKTSLFIVTFVLNCVNINTSKSGNIIYLSENLVFYIFKLVPFFKYTRQAIEKNRMSLNRAISKVWRMKAPQIINNSEHLNSNPSFDSKLSENRYTNIRTIEITSPMKELLEKFEGCWVLLRSNSDSLQEINAALGVSWFIRRAIDKINPIVHYDVDTLRGIVSISTTLIMGLNNRTTLIINKTKNLGKNSFEEIENNRIEEFRMEEEISDNLSMSHDECGLYRQYSNKRKKSFEKYLVFEQPNTTLEWSEDKTNIILETRQNREGFKMIETRSIVPSYKLPFKIKGNDGKIIENRRQDILCYKIILKGKKRTFSSKNNLLVCCRYFIKTEVISHKDLDSNSRERNILQANYNPSKCSILTDTLYDVKKESAKPYFIGESNEFPLTIQQLIIEEDSIFKVVVDKRIELLEYTRKLVSEIDNGTKKWSLERSSNGMKVYKREIDGQPFMSCGITSILLNNDVRQFNITSNNYEIEHTNKISSIKDIVDYIWDSNNKMYYDPMVEKSDPMHYFKNDENICIFYQAFKGQWGVSGRDFVVICYRYKPDANELSNKDESQYEYILTQSIEWPIINSSYVRAKNYFATYVFRPLGENEVQALYFNQVDLHTDISSWIIKRVILDQMNSLIMLRDILQKK